jgi:hypothetical protein
MLRLVLALSLACACSDPPTPAPAPAAPAAPRPRKPALSSEEVCAVHCERAADCGVVAEACAEDCPARDKDLSGMRDDYLAQLGLCLEGASCSSVSQRTAFGACHEYVVTTLKVTPALRRFCFAGARRAARCGRAADADQSECLSQFRYFNEETLAHALACMDAPCAEVPSCMAARLTGMTR